MGTRHLVPPTMPAIGEDAVPAFSSARNLRWNVAGLALPLAAAFVALPLLIQNFGLERFGAFSLVLAAYAYVSVLDLGLASAITFRVAEALARGEPRERMLKLVYTAGTVVVALGCAFAVIGWFVAGWAPSLIDGAAPGLAEETVQGLRILAVSLPAVFVGTLLAALLSGHSRFAQVNAVRIVSGVLFTLGPALASFWRPDIAWACCILAAVRLGAAAIYLLQCRALLRPHSEHVTWRPSRGALATLLSFGSWLTVSNLVGPLMVYVDRFYLAMVRPVAEVSYYVAPYELATKLALIPAGVLPVLFPMLVARWVHRSAGGNQLPVQLASAMAVGCAIPAAAMAVLGPEVMLYWMKAQVPESSAAALQVLAGAVYLNCVAQVFFMQLQAMGRTDVVAKLHLCELALYAVLLWAFTERWGVVGVAAAWGLRVAVDCIFLCGFVGARISKIERRECWRVTGFSVVLATTLSAMAWIPSLWIRVAIACVLSAVGFAVRRTLLASVLGPPTGRRL
jgi:O-antigen/teichoic acid export membrane protein